MRKFIALFLIVLLAFFSLNTEARLLGGYSEVQSARNDEHISSIVDLASDNLLSSGSFSKGAVITPIEYSSQIVAGTNYKIKVRIDDEGNVGYAQINVFVPLPPNQEDVEVTLFKPISLETPLA